MSDLLTTTIALPTASTSPIDAPALLEQFRATGSEFAFEQIVRAYAGMVYTVCLGVTKNAHDAEDSAQATFLSLATQVKLGKTVKFVGPWLRQVAKRTALDHRKSRQRRERREATHGRETADRVQPHEGEALLDGETYREALHAELNKLPERYRAPLKLHYLGGLNAEEAALELNCKPQTLAVRLHRGRKMLAANLSKRGLFLSAEMLGLSSMPIFSTAFKTGAMHSMSHAATVSQAVVAQGTIASIVAKTMAIVRTSANVMFFTKMKFAVLLLLAAGPLLANGARIAQVVSKISLQLPTLNFDLSQWIRPLLKTVSTTTSSHALVANASQSRPSFSQFAAQDGASFPQLSLTSSDDVNSFSLSRLPASYNSNDSRIVLASASANESFGELHLRMSDDRQATDQYGAPIGSTPRSFLSLNSVESGSSVTPEPTAATFMSLSVLALRRRRTPAR